MGQIGFDVEGKEQRIVLAALEPPQPSEHSVTANDNAQAEAA